MIIWMVGDGFRLKCVGERFRIVFDDNCFEVAARHVDLVIVDGDGFLSSGVLGLAGSFNIPVIIVDFDGYCLGYVFNLDFNFNVDVVVNQFDRFEEFRERYGYVFVKSFVDGCRDVFRFYGLSDVANRVSSLDCVDSCLDVIGGVLGDWVDIYRYFRLLGCGVCLGLLVRYGFYPFLGVVHDNDFALAWDFELLVDSFTSLFCSLKLMFDDIYGDLSDHNFRRFIVRFLADRYKRIFDWLDRCVRSFKRCIVSFNVDFKPRLEFDSYG